MTDQAAQSSAGQLLCSRCSKVVAPGAEYMVLAATRTTPPAVLCLECGQAKQSEWEEKARNINLPRAIAGGLAGAVLGALVWYGFTVVTDRQIGLLAMLIGWLAAQGAILGSGKKRGPALQAIAVVVTAGAFLLAEYLILNHFFNQSLAEDGLGRRWLSLDGFFRTYFDYLRDNARNLLDLLFLGIALWMAYRTPAHGELDMVPQRNVA